MLFARMQTLLDEMASDLLCGDTAAIAARCAYPMVVHAPDRVLTFAAPEDYADRLTRVAAELRDAHRVVAITAHVSAVDLPRNGRFRAWARLRYIFVANRPPRETCLTYFCRLNGTRITVEMVEMDCDLLPGVPTRERAA